MLLRLVFARPGCRWIAHMLQRHADEASRIAKAVVQQGPLGRGCQTVLVWLLDAADSSKQTQASTRAKAIKALGLVAEIDPELLAKSTVQGCLNKALQVTFTCVTCASCCALGRRRACVLCTGCAQLDTGNTGHVIS